VAAVWDYQASVERKGSTGGTSRASVLDQIGKIEAFANSL
jgi:hypothetical protein